MQRLQKVSQGPFEKTPHLPAPVAVLPLSSQGQNFALGVEIREICVLLNNFRAQLGAFSVVFGCSTCGNLK